MEAQRKLNQAPRSVWSEVSEVIAWTDPFLVLRQTGSAVPAWCVARIRLQSSSCQLEVGRAPERASNLPDFNRSSVESCRIPTRQNTGSIGRGLQGVR